MISRQFSSTLITAIMLLAGCGSGFNAGSFAGGNHRSLSPNQGNQHGNGNHWDADQAAGKCPPGDEICKASFGQGQDYRDDRDDRDLMIEDGKANSYVTKLAVEENSRAYLVLLRDTSRSMRDFNKQYGNGLANNLVLEANQFSSITRTCSSDSKSYNAPLDVIRHFAARTGTGSGGKGCPSQITSDLNSLSAPHHLILFVITDHPTSSIAPFSSDQAIINYAQALESRPNIASVSIHGAIKGTSLTSWANIPSKYRGHFEGGQLNAAEVFRKVADNVRFKKVLRTVSLTSMMHQIVDPLFYLNGRLLGPNEFSYVNGTLTLSDSIQVNEGDTVTVRY